MIPIDSKKRLFWLLILAFVLVKSLLAFKSHAVIWDEAVYFGMGKFIYSAGAAGMWEAIRPLGLPVLLGAVWKAGLPAFFAEILVIAFAAGSVFLTYLTAKEIFNESVGLMAALLVAGTSVFFQQSSLFLTEIPSTFFAMMAIYMLAKDRLALGSAFAFAAAMFKFPHFLMLPALFILPAFRFYLGRNFSRSFKDILKLGFPYAAAGLLFLAGNYFAYSSGPVDLEAAFEPLSLAMVHQSNAAHAVEGAAGNLLFYPIELVKQNVFYAFLPLGLIFFARERFSDPRLAVLAGYLILYLSYLTYITNKQERFALLFLPVAAIFSAYGFYRILIARRGTSAAGILLTALILAMGVFAAVNVISADADSIIQRLNSAYPEKYSLSQGTVLSSEPLVAYYADNRIIPYYFSTADGTEGIDAAVSRFEKNREGRQIIFNREDFYCEDYDSHCRKQLSRISQR